MGTGKSCNSSIAGTGNGTSASGVTVSLTKFTNDAQSATVNFCMSVSLHTYTLDTAPSLLVDQEPLSFLSGGSDFTSGPGCMEMTYQVGSSQIEQASRIALLIDGSLRMSPPPGNPDVACQAARFALAAQYPGPGFSMPFQHGGYYTNLQQPAGMKREQANTLIVDTIEGAIYGPWTLIIK